RLSRHYGFLPWAGEELMGLLSRPMTPLDLKVLVEVIALINEAPAWIPDSAENGPDYRRVLGCFYDIFDRLRDKTSLSFLDAALLLPAVHYQPDQWPILLSRAVQRYDVR